MVLNRYMSIQLLLEQLGLGQKSKGQQGRMSPMVKERIRFEQDVRRQFVELKKKGISIPVFTL